MWSDVFLTEKNNEFSWRTSTAKFAWDFHGNDQMLDYTEANFNGIKGQFVFKAICPWRIITPPGWSVLQLPLFYHFNKEWSVFPGVIDTDIHHEINQQVLYHGEGKEVQIKMGDPFVLYIPFKRSNKLNHEVRYQTAEEIKTFNRNSLAIEQSFSPNGTYRKMQRKRDKELS
jgi:hypothetical protein